MLRRLNQWWRSASYSRLEEMEDEEKQQVRVDLRLESILKILKSSSHEYVYLRRLCKEFFFTPKGALLSIGLGGSIAGSLFYMASAMSYSMPSLREEYKLNDCDSNYQNNTKVCNDILYKINSGDKDLFIFFILGVCFSFLQSGVMHLLRPIIYRPLLLFDFLNPIQLDLLNRNHISPDIEIEGGAEALQTLIQSRDCYGILLADLWKMIEGYLAPLEKIKNELDEEKIKKEVSADFIPNFDLERMIKEAEKYEKEADECANTLEELLETKEENEEIQANLYEPMLTQARQIKVLTEKNKIYHEEAVRKMKLALTSFNVKNQSQRERKEAKGQLHLANQAGKITLAIEDKLTFFSKNVVKQSLDKCVHFREVANKLAKVDENKDCLLVVRRLGSVN